MPLSDNRNIYLIGPRASGKTTLGRRLAARLSRPFVDLDAVFLERHGETIATLVTREGWEAFRRAEAAILADVAARPGQVVATGGGAVLLPENRALLTTGLVLYLQASPERLAERLLADCQAGQRPKLTELELRDEIVATLKEREPLYLSLAGACLPERTPEDLEDFAVKALEMLGERP